EVRDMDYEKSLTDKVVEKPFMTLTKKRLAERVNPSIQLPTNCGNMYCGSVYGGLDSVIGLVDSSALQGTRIAVLIYGSGLAASFFSLRVTGSTEKIAKTLDIPNMLAARRAVPPETYDAVSLGTEPSDCTLGPLFLLTGSFADVRSPKEGAPPEELHPRRR